MPLSICYTIDYVYIVATYKSTEYYSFFFLLLYVQGYCYKEKKMFKNLSMPRVYMRVRVWAREYYLSRKSYMIFRNINILTC